MGNANSPEPAPPPRPKVRTPHPPVTRRSHSLSQLLYSMAQMSDLKCALQGNDEEQALALKSLRVLCIGDRNLVALGSESGLLPLLRDIVTSQLSNGADLIVVLGILLKLSRLDEIEVAMASPELGLLHVLTEVVRQRDGEELVLALNVLQNLSCNIDNKLLLIAFDLGLLPLLVEVAGKGDKPDVLAALAVLKNLAASQAVHPAMATPRLGLFQVLVGLISMGDEDFSPKALSVLKNLAIGRQNENALGSAELGLVPLLMAIAAEQSGEQRVMALDILCIVSSSAALVDPDFLPVLVGIVENEAEEETIAAFGLLCAISAATTLSVESAIQGLLPAITSVVAKRSGTLRMKALTVLKSVAKLTALKPSIGSPDLGLLPLLIDDISSQDIEAAVIALELVHLLSSSPDNHVYLVSADLDLLSLLNYLAPQLSDEPAIEWILEIQHNLADVLGKVNTIASKIQRGFGVELEVFIACIHYQNNVLDAKLEVEIGKGVAGLAAYKEAHKRKAELRSRWDMCFFYSNLLRWNIG